MFQSGENHVRRSCKSIEVKQTVGSEKGGMSLCVIPLLSFLIPLSPSHTQYTMLLTSLPPIVYPSNDSQDDGNTALAWAIENPCGEAGCAECVALLRAAGAV